MVEVKKVTKIRKRDGQVVSFDKEKIAAVILKAGRATGEFGKKEAGKLADSVTRALNKKYDGFKIPTVEEIQDIVEETLMKKGWYQTARAYILYRGRHAKLRRVKLLLGETTKLIKDYVQQTDWRVKENANMDYSLQGLNNHIASSVIARYWLQEIFPPKVARAHIEGDFHLHDLGFLGAYCVGWDLYDLLTEGFKGVPGKIQSRPAKHFRVALGQVVNFMYTLQGEAAGAQALSNFDTLLAPFIAYDKLSYSEVKQAMQEFLYNMMVPTRVGFQCVSEDTEILTPEGWKNYREVKKGDLIKTFNLQNQEIEDQEVASVFRKHYQGIMYNLKNRIQDQLISPEHRVVRRKFQTIDKYVLEPIEDVMKLKSPFIIPIAGKNPNKKVEISDEQIKLMAWIIAEGSIGRPGKHRCCYRVSIYQSKIKNKENYQEIKNLLDHFGFQYSEFETSSLGSNVVRFRLNAASSRTIHRWFGTRENVHFIPDLLLNLNEEQSRLFLETYLKADGTEGCKISTTDPSLLEELQRLVVNCGYGFTVLVRQPTIGKKEIYVLRIIKHQETYIQKVKKVKYKGVIWSPHTKNETVIARRKGKVFITGNTPFTNLTFDLTVPPDFAHQPVIIGGKPQKRKYAEFQKEMDMLNKAFAEVMLEGDAKGRVFSFPIPTYNLTPDFNWDNPTLKPVFEMSAKYGIPYWANFVNSDMKPEETRSMCFPSNERIFYKNENQTPRVCYSTVSRVVNSYLASEGRRNVSLFLNGKFFKVKKVYRLKNKKGKIIKITLKNGETLRMTDDHPAMVIEGGKLVKKRAELLKKGDSIPLAKTSYQGNLGDFEMGRFVGLYIAEGSITKRGCVYFSFNRKERKLIDFVKKVVEERLAAPVRITYDPRWQTTQLWIDSRVVVELMKRFCIGQGAKEKRLTSKLFGMSKDFRLGVLVGIYQGDGYERDMDFHTTNRKLRDMVGHLAASLGTCYFKRTNNKNTKDGRKFTSYVLRISTNSYEDLRPYFPSLRSARSTVFAEYKNFWGVKIAKIERLTHTQDVYDFEIEGNEHLFQMANGIITHNCCRLRLNLTELIKRGGGYFGANALTGCYDKKTEILTENGWKLFKDLSKKEKVFTLAEDSKIELHKPKKIFEYDWEGEMYRFKAKSLDLLVTPNHRMVVETAYKVRKFVEAQDFDVNNHRIPKRSIWEGKEEKWFILPSISFIKYGRQGRTPYEVVRNSLKIKMDDWLKFFGMWVAEGSADNEKIAPDYGYRVVITQKNKNKREEIRKVLDNLPFNYYEDKNKTHFVICNKQLWTYLRQFGVCYAKFVPEEMKALSKRQLSILFDWLVKGDGHIRKTTGQISYYTSSKKLADDVQEIVLKLGYLSTITARKGRVTRIRGRKIKGGVTYCLGVQQSRYYCPHKKSIKKEHYKGKVYCCEVSNHTVLVRRNGRICWCGNSIGVVTLNMGRIGYLAKSKKAFLNRVGRLMDLAKEALEVKRKVIERFTERGLYPYSKFYLRGNKERLGGYWSGHFSTIGLNGLNEGLFNFMGKNIATASGRKFAKKVLDYMRDKLVDYQKETNNLYNLEATPAEGSLAPEEKVLISQSDPNLAEIGPLIDKYLEENRDKVQIFGYSEVLKLSEGEMFTWGFNRQTLKIKKYPVTGLIRHPGKSMYEIKTFSGRKVKVTGQHSVFTLSHDGVPQEVLINRLKQGDSIAVPKKIEMEEVYREFNLLEFFKDFSLVDRLYGVFPSDFIEKLVSHPEVKKWCSRYYQFAWKDVKFMWKKNRVVPLKLVYNLDIKIKRSVLKASKIFYRKSKNTKPVNILVPIDRKFGFIIGSLLAEGWLGERIEFVNADKFFAKEFFQVASGLFGKESVKLSYRKRKSPRKSQYIITLGKMASLFLDKIGLVGKSNKKKIPSPIFFSSSHCIKGLLRGFYLGDGYFWNNKKKNDFSIRLYTNSQELIEGLNLLLLRLGILAKIRTEEKRKKSWKKNFVLSITGAENLEKFFKFVLEKDWKFGKTHSGREIIPSVPRLVKSIMQKHSIRPADISIWKDSLNKNARQGRMSIQYFRQIIQRLSRIIEDERLEKLRILTNSDLYWDKVKKIKRLSSPKYVYDLEVEVGNDLVNNFLGGEGLVCLHNTSYRLAKIDKKKYPEIIVANEKQVKKGAAPFYTNSSQLPVDFTDDLFYALKLQDPLQTRYTGGTTFHIFLGERLESGEGVKVLAKKIVENFGLPYFSFTPTFSICSEHGYLKGEHQKCPKCGVVCEIYSRVVGYLRPVSQWNKGKRAEFKVRKSFKTK